jgi:hypothetical protein
VKSEEMEPETPFELEDATTFSYQTKRCLLIRWVHEECILFDRGIDGSYNMKQSEIRLLCLAFCVRACVFRGVDMWSMWKDEVFCVFCEMRRESHTAKEYHWCLRYILLFPHLSAQSYTPLEPKRTSERVFSV